MSIKGLLPRNVLIPVAAAGIVLSIGIAIAAVYFLVIRDTALFPRPQSAVFWQELNVYDTALFRESAENAERALRRLERQAGAYEERLSVLKRWRSLARGNPRFFSGYEEAILKAVNDFPYADDLAALALEAGFLENGDPFRSREHIVRLYNQRYAPLLLSYHALAGNMETPYTASAILGINSLLSADLSRIPPEILINLKINDLLFRIVKNDLQNVSMELSNLIAANPQNLRLLRLGAEYFYDFGNPLYAASLFSRFGDTSSIARQADSLLLANEISAARMLLNILAVGSSSGNSRYTPSEDVLPEVYLRVLYNLAATSQTESEARQWLEQMMAKGALDKMSASGLFGIIRYSRFFDSQRGIAMLEGGNDPILDLELFRRKMDIWPHDRWVPEVWLLLGRHPEEEGLYRWAAAFFEKQKFFVEGAQLLRLTANHPFEGAWIELHTGLVLMREGNLIEAEKALKEALNKSSASGDISPWLVYANLGRINESRRSIAAAVDNYEAAAVLADNVQDAVNIQLRLLRCYEALGRFAEGRQALQKAEGLDPDNINVRHELSRIGMGGF